MDPLFHILVPLVILLAIFPKINKKLVFGLLFLTILPDIDYFTSLHRILSHNIFFAIIVCLIIFLIIGKLAGYISIFYLASHLLFDVADVGIALLWPFYKSFIGLEMAIKNVSGKIIFNFGFVTNSIGIRETFTTSTYLHTITSFVVILIIIVFLIKYFKK